MARQNPYLALAVTDQLRLQCSGQSYNLHESAAPTQDSILSSPQTSVIGRKGKTLWLTSLTLAPAYKP